MRKKKGTLNLREITQIYTPFRVKNIHSLELRYYHKYAKTFNEHKIRRIKNIIAYRSLYTRPIGWNEDF